MQQCMQTDTRGQLGNITIISGSDCFYCTLVQSSALIPLVKLVVAALPLPGTTPKAVAAAQSFQRKKVIILL